MVKNCAECGLNHAMRRGAQTYMRCEICGAIICRPTTDKRFGERMALRRGAGVEPLSGQCWHVHYAKHYDKGEA